MKKITKGWSPQRRQKQAQNCRKTRPWAQATGPRTDGGKARVKRNARKHGFYSAEIATLKQLLRMHKALISAHCPSTESAKHASKNP